MPMLLITVLNVTLLVSKHELLSGSLVLVQSVASQLRDCWILLSVNKVSLQQRLMLLSQSQPPAIAILMALESRYAMLMHAVTVPCMQ